VISTLKRSKNIDKSTDELIDKSYELGQSKVTYNFLAGHYGFLGRLLIPWFGSRNHRAFHWLLAALPTVGIWFATLGVASIALNLNGFNFHHSILDSRGNVIYSEADLLNRASLGLQAMHAPNTHHFPSLLSSGEPILIGSSNSG
jgi:photosystem II P680 reaction center D1 protein